MPEKKAPTGKYWEPTEYKLPPEKQYEITPRTIGERRPRKPSGRNSYLPGTSPEPRNRPEPPRPVPSQPIRPPIQTRKMPTERTRSNRGTVINQPHVIKGETQPYEGGSKRTTGITGKPKTEAEILAQKHQYRREAEAAFPGDEERQDAYVYGKMREAGWRPEHHSPWDGKTYKHWWWGVQKV